MHRAFPTPAVCVPNSRRLLLPTFPISPTLTLTSTTYLSGWLFAGLVDGTLRAWPPSALAATSSDATTDTTTDATADANIDANADAELVEEGYEPPVAVADAHEGRVTHLVAATRGGCKLLVSAGLDGWVG